MRDLLQRARESLGVAREPDGARIGQVLALARAMSFTNVIPLKIISGAQTGADRAALDAALEHGIDIGGWVPKGRKAEDGRVSDRYPNLRETPGDGYETRTRWNVRDSDATLILSHGPLTGGSKFTETVARELGKPVLHVDLSTISTPRAVAAVRGWLLGLAGDTLNVAGPRASNDAAIYERTKAIVKALLLGETID